VPNTVPRYSPGDRARIRYSGGMPGRIVEPRGPPAPVDRVRIPYRPKPSYIEVREDQLVRLPPKKKPDPGSASAA